MTKGWQYGKTFNERHKQGKKFLTVKEAKRIQRLKVESGLDKAFVEKKA